MIIRSLRNLKTGTTIVCITVDTFCGQIVSSIMLEKENTVIF